MESYVQGEFDPSAQRRLEAFIEECAADGGRSGAWGLFDWDFTLFHGDIGDSIFAYLLENGLFYRPAHWQETSEHFTPEALQVLETLTRREPGERIPATDKLRREMAHIYFEQATTGQAPAFTGYDAADCHPSYAWCARMLAGFTPAEIYRTTHEVLDALLQAPPVAGGGRAFGNFWARPAAPMMRLLRRLQETGLSVAVVSASPQPVVEACLTYFGLSVVHVLGVRTELDAAGRLSHRVAPCGRRGGVIPYGRGKRAWASFVLQGREEPAWDQPDPDLALWFAAGDSDGDWAMLHDASRLRLVVAHRENRVTAVARRNHDGRWLLNAPFFGA